MSKIMHNNSIIQNNLIMLSLHLDTSLPHAFLFMKALINSMVAFYTHTTSVMRWNLKASLCYWLAAATLPKTLVRNVINTVLSKFTVAIVVKPWALNGLKTGLKSHNYCV